MYHACCNLTNFELYECDTPTVTKDVYGKDGDKVLGSFSRYIEPVGLNYNIGSDLRFEGRQNAKVYRMFLEPEDIYKFRVGQKIRFNFTKMYKDSVYDKNLKPYIYDNTINDIEDLEIHQIDSFAGLNEHYEAYLISYN
jgi:hypothetical protein